MKIQLPATDAKTRLFMIFDLVLISCIFIFLLLYLITRYIYFDQIFINISIVALGCLSIMGLIPVLNNVFQAMRRKEVTIDLLASIALISSLSMREWTSAAFITLMLVFARILAYITDAKAKNIIKSLMKYHVEWVRIRIGDDIKEVNIKDVKKGDLVIVEDGNNIPVDGTVVSGQAEINESSLTGESELVPKKRGDKVFTSTISESGSIIVRTERVGTDTMLARIINLVDESSRQKNKVERLANKFSEWYIGVVVFASISMYVLGVDTKIILAILLVVCADDVAVAVPLSYTLAMSAAARKGVIVKGSGALEQLSRMKYLLTDKTGTLTRGRPKVANVNVYGKWSREEVLSFFASGASESNHTVSRAIIEYSQKENIKSHVPDAFEEISGQGVTFSHDGKSFVMGRQSFVEDQGCKISDKMKADDETEKDHGRGLVFIGVDKEIAGVLSYVDDLRPHISEIIKEMKVLGIREWHMLTGDNERVAKAISSEIGITHFHANLTPEAKVDFIREFEKKHHTRVSGHEDISGIVGYMGDGVNDAASLALADVSIAMGDTGSDASIEAADITIIKANLDRLPDIIKIARNAQKVVKTNFVIWGVTNFIGLLLVIVGLPGLGKIGPAGAAMFNFITDFVPILNSFRARRG